MKKIISIFIITLLTFSCFAKELNGLFDIEFGSSRKTVEKKMKALGWTKIDKTPGSTTFKKIAGTYAGLPVEDIVIRYDNDNFVMCNIHYDNENEYFTNTDNFDTVDYNLELFMKEYNLKKIESSLTDDIPSVKPFIFYNSESLNFVTISNTPTSSTISLIKNYLSILNLESSFANEL